MFIGIGMNVGAGTRGGGLSYLYRDQFTTDRAAGALNGTAAEPGPGTRTVTDTTSKYSISGAKTVIVQGANVSATDPQMYSTATFSNTCGLASYTRVGFLNSNFSAQQWGLSASVGAVSIANLGNINSFNMVRPGCGGSGSGIDHGRQLAAATNLVYTDPMDIETLVISRAPGAFWFHRLKNGPWELVFIDGTTTETNPHWRWATITNGAPMYCYEAGVSNDLPNVWKATRYGIAIDRKATTLANDTLTTQANGWVEHTITAATGVTQKLYVRYTDASNHWYVECDQTNSTIKLFEVVAGVPTQRGTTGVTQTWTNATAFVLKVKLTTYCIRVFVDRLFKVQYTAAYTNATATTAKVSHAGTEFVSWPLNVSLTIGSPTVQRLILGFGDSKTNGQGDDTSPYPLGQNGYPLYLCQNLTAATGQIWKEQPLRLGVSSTTAALRRASIDADIALRYGDPDYVICNLGVNDGVAIDQTAFEADYGYCLDAMHARWPLARMGLMFPGKSIGNWSAMHGYILDIIAARSSYCFAGPDETVYLAGSDNYATYTVDGIHPTHAGYLLTATQWQSKMGY